MRGTITDSVPDAFMSASAGYPGTNPPMIVARSPIPGRYLLVLVLAVVLILATVYADVILDERTVRQGADISIRADVALKGTVTIILDRGTPMEKNVYKHTFDINHGTGGVVVPLTAGNHTMWVNASFAYLSKNSYPSTFEVLPDRITELKVHIVAGS